MPPCSKLPVTVSPDLRVTADRDAALTPGQALAFAEQLTLAAMLRQAALMPRRRMTRTAYPGATRFGPLARKAVAP